MRILRIAALSAALAALTCAMSCGGSVPRSSMGAESRPDQFAAGPAFSLPAPSSLPRNSAPQPTAPQAAPGRETSEAFLLFGAYNFALPNNRVSTSGTLDLHMDPDYTPGGPLAGAAYCIYTVMNAAENFESQDPKLYIGEEALVAAGAASELFVGFANFSTDRWDWFRFSSLPGEAGPESADDYINGADQLLFALVAIGNADWTLDTAKVGNDPPAFELHPTIPVGGNAPLEVDFLIDINFNSEGTVEFIEWDFENDGTFELMTAGDVLEQSHTYDVPGVYQAAARLTDFEGASSIELSGEISATSHLIRTWSAGTGGDEEGRALAEDSVGNVFVCGTVSGKALLLKFDSDLNLLWSKTWEPVSISGFAEYFDLVCIGTNVYLTGFVFHSDGPPNDFDAILHGYDENGNLTLQKSYGDPSLDDQGFAIATDGTDLFMAGFANQASNPGTAMFVARLDTSGTIEWSGFGREFANPFFRDAGTALEFWAAESSVVVQAGFSEAAFDPSPACLLKLDAETGMLEWQRFYDFDGELFDDRPLFCCSLIESQSDMKVVGRADNGGFDPEIVVFGVNSDGSSGGGRFFGDQYTPGSRAAAYSPDFGTLAYAGTLTFEGYVTYQPASGDSIPYVELNNSGNGANEVFDVISSMSGNFFSCGQINFLDQAAGENKWDKAFDTAGDTISVDAKVSSIVLETWSPTVLNTTIDPVVVDGTLDAGADFYDLMISKMDPAI